MRSMKKFGVLVAVLALSAIGAANAAAHTPATFTASATGSITGKQLENQEFTVNAGTVRCSTLTASGTIKSVASPEQHAHVTYKGCTAFGGFIPVHDITATYNFTADNTVHIVDPITITVTGPFGTCHITVAGKQQVGTVTYSNKGGAIELTPHVTGIKYTSSGGSCGTAGTYTNGTYTGNSEVSRVGGGTISWDATKP